MHDELLSLLKTRAHGGTLALWRKELDLFVRILDPPSSRILALVLDKPEYQVSIHVTIYLSTAGKDPEFMEDLTLLSDTIDDIQEKHPDCILYIRGDANASYIPRPSQTKCDSLLKHFCEGIWFFGDIAN